MTRADEWVRCNECGHKLLKDVDSLDYDIEIKCSSCKCINRLIKINGRLSVLKGTVKDQK